MGEFPNPFRKARGIFSTHLGGPRSSSEISRERAAHDAKERERANAPKPEHLAKIADLKAHLEAKGMPDACRAFEIGVIQCDPWKFEPILLDELIDARIEGDEEKLNRLRDLIRAGSWMTYDRVDTAGALKDFDSVIARETQHLEWKIRHADPDTSKELAVRLKELKWELEDVRAALAENRMGPSAETATRTVEDLQTTAWSDIKKFCTAHGTRVENARTHTATKPLFDEINRLRRVRDLFYFRRLHPSWLGKRV